MDGRLRPGATGPEAAAGRGLERSGALVVRHRIEPDGADALYAIRPGDGAVVDVGGEHCAAFRDDSGLLHMVSALCPHSGCTVGFNDAEKTWECPCHGSRFATDGALLQGPAAEPLAPARAYLAMAAAE